jgi:hypothetical protein
VTVGLATRTLRTQVGGEGAADLVEVGHVGAQDLDLERGQGGRDDQLVQAVAAHGAGEHGPQRGADLVLARHDRGDALVADVEAVVVELDVLHVGEVHRPHVLVDDLEAEAGDQRQLVAEVHRRRLKTRRLRLPG